MKLRVGMSEYKITQEDKYDIELHYKLKKQNYYRSPRCHIKLPTNKLCTPELQEFYYHSPAQVGVASASPPHQRGQVCHRSTDHLPLVPY